MRGTVDSATQFITLIVLLLTFVISLVITQFIRRRRDLYALRDIPAFSRLPRIIGEAIEADRPIQVALANSGLGGSTTILSLANAEFAYHVLQRSVISGSAPILAVNEATALPLALDTLRRAYQSRGLLSRYASGAGRWYPGGALGLAGALTASMGDDRVEANLLTGNFGAELALAAGAAARRGQRVIATSAIPEGQAVAYVMSDERLIGEEIFAAGAYLDGAASQIAGIVTLDVLRWLLVIGILLAVADGMTGGLFSRSLVSLVAR
jgi:hypothetical protein